MADRKVRIAVEGNIGCGKSTFLEEIKAIYPNVETFPEPIDKWSDVGGFNLFENFYKAPHKWCTPFRSHVMTTIGEQLSKPQITKVRLIERSIHSNFHCFTEANRES
nr:deoxynucleoside kinase [Hymenolepis microstoma]